METLTLTAETGRLLNLVVHSLYTRPEVFLRELVSNASDGLDRLRFETVLHPDLDDGSRREIRLEVDVAARRLTVRDNGIGMSRQEVIDHIGTIARSGTQELGARLDAESDRARMVDMIGRFGVGFYSCFMVADHVTLVTRRAQEPSGTRWESDGQVEYRLAEAPDAAPGTSVTLHLKPVDQDAGIEDYTDRIVLSRIISRYADFITHPIVYIGPDTAGASTPAADGRAAVLNSMNPIWTRPKSDVSAQEYAEFYKHLSHDWDAPLFQMSFKAEGRWEYAALLFVPSHAPYDLYYHGVTFGLQLHSQRMLIVENCEELLPRYLRFVKGVVDAADLPLNVSRQTLQQAHHLANIRKWISRKAIDALNGLREQDADKYRTLWSEFGRALKEGVSEDPDNRERLVSLLLFESSNDATQLTSLSDYVSRMKPGETEILYLAGESRSVIEHSPHLERVRAKGCEVLYFTEPVDELAAQALGTFEGRRLRSVAKGKLSIDDEAGQESAEKSAESEERLKALVALLAKHLDSRVRGVRLSTRLTMSAACLAGEEFDLSPHIERLLHRQSSRRMLELNPAHPIVQALQERCQRDEGDPMLAVAADVLFGLAVLSEGSDLPDPVSFREGITRLLDSCLRSGAPVGDEGAVIRSS